MNELEPGGCSNPARSMICSHGLTDLVQITQFSLIQDLERGQETRIYRYRCATHHRHGVCSVTRTLAAPTTDNQ